MAVQDCGVEQCPEHSWCAYHGDEPDRCPWCHRSWLLIITRVEAGTGRHSCEDGRNRTGEDRKWRVAQAREMRLAETETREHAPRSTHCAHRAQDAGKARWTPVAAGG